MKTLLAQQGWTFGFELDPPADAGSVSWTLRGNAGNVMSGFASVPVANLAGANQVAIAVPAAANAKTLTVGLKENRFLQVFWKSSGGDYDTLTAYQLGDFMPILVTPGMVRTACGLTIAELPDVEIDIPTGATMVSIDLGATIFNAALIAGDETTPLLNLLIAYRCVLNLGPSIQVRIAQVMTEGDTSFQRLRNLTVTDLLDQLGNEYDRIRSLITGVVPVVPILFTKSRRPTLPSWNGYGVGVGYRDAMFPISPLNFNFEAPAAGLDIFNDDEEELIGTMLTLRDGSPIEFQRLQSIIAVNDLNIDEIQVGDVLLLPDRTIISLQRDGSQITIRN